MAGAAAVVMAGLGLVTNYASASVPGWATRSWVVWLVFAVLLATAVGLLLWGRHLDGERPAARLTSVDRPAGSRHGSLRYPHVERVRGREAELAVLTRMLRRPQDEFAVVCGAGGLGKTTVAAQLAARAEEDGRQVFWVRWRDSVDLAQQMTRVAVACGLSEADLEAARAGRESLPDVVWRQLAFSRRRWLLVLDNVDEPQAVDVEGEPVAHYRGWIRPHGRGLLLITSRDTSEQTWGRRARLLPLRPLAVPDAGQVLLDAASRAGTRAQAQELAERLGRLPLALHAAGSYLATPTSRYRTFERYHQALDAELGTLLGAEHPDASDPDTARTVVRHTWELSLDQLAAEGHVLARPLLRMLSILAAAPVPLFLVTPGLLTAATGRSATTAGVEAALAGLYRYGLLDLPEEPGPQARPASGDDPPARVALHPLVREISALALAADTPNLIVWRQAMATRLTEAAHDTARAGRSGWSAARLLAPHLPLLLDHTTVPQDLTDIGDILNRLADVLHDAGAYTPAHALSRHLLHAQTRVLGADHPSTLGSRHSLAKALDGMGRYAQAADLHRQNLVARTRVLGPDHPDALTSRNNLANALYGMGRYAQAADLHRQNLVARTRVLGPDHPDALTSRNNLANALNGMGQCVRAVDLHRRNLAARTRVLGPDHPHTLASRNNLAFALDGTGRHARAADLHRQVLADRARVLGPDHPHTLSSRHNLADALYGMGRYVEAADLYRQALADYLRVLGPDHPHALGSRHNLADALYGMGRYAEAADHHRQNLVARTRVLGPDHPDTLTSRDGLETALLTSTRRDGLRRSR
ncbi:tetratricopeptide repeat protein [Streptomyces sp. 13-12-16]|uniref:tetratricopeptide repeat protein n=1 Tax=Streptomyces sp. 13-12-16 TaxID=1570823 RepID=UPI00211A7B2A|nr:tetratricopeptide repeat protein [Streptomyces sp. 13-12-16]